MEIEIEFKNLLIKQQYENLIAQFEIKPEQVVRQANHYFETPEGTFKQLKAALRVRELANSAELTLKEATSTHQSLETTDTLTLEQAKLAVSTLQFPQGNVMNRLSTLGINPSSLSLFGTLTTDRVEIPYEGGLLVLDHSFYLQQDDYEVEYETTNELQGLQVFENFLMQHGINKQTAPKKIARFMNALQQKG